MTTLFRLALFGLALSALPAASAAPAAKDPPALADETLALIPPKAIAVVQVHGIERVQDRLAKLLQSAVPDKADAATKAVRDGIGQALAGRDLTTLRGDGRILVAIADLDKLPDNATLTFLFPAKDVDGFKNGFLTEDERKSLAKDGDLETVKWEEREEPFYLVPVKGYVVISSDKETAQKYRSGDVGGVGKLLSPETARAFLDADVSVFVNVREVNARHGEQIKQFKGLAEVFLKGDTPGVSKTQIEQLKTVLDAAFQVVEDGTAAVLGFELRPDGAMLRGLAQFGESTPTNEALKKYRPASLAEVGTLPAGQMGYSASNLQAAGSKSAAAFGAFTATDEDPAAKETIEGVLKELGNLDQGVTLSAGNMMGGRGLEVTLSKDAAKVADARLRLLKALTKTGTYINFPLKDKPEVKEAAQKVGGFTLHAVKMSFDFDKAVADQPEEARELAKTAMKRVLGGDEMNVWVGTDGKAAVQIVAKDWAEAKGLLEAYQAQSQTVGKEEPFQFTRKQLPAEANLLLALDTARMVHSLFGIVKDSVGAVPNLPIQIPDLKAPDGPPSYLGIALVLKAGHGSFEVFVPAAAAGQVRKLIQPLLDKDN